MFDAPVRDDLTHGERLLLRCLRGIVLDSGCEAPRAQFADACGCAGEGAYRALQAFTQQLRLWGRRRLEMLPPMDPRISADEALILDAFACAQAEDYGLLDARLVALTQGSAPATLGEAACWVAQAFAMNGLELPGRPDKARVAHWRIAAE